MKAKKWPFRPDHITNNGERYQKTRLSKLNGPGIISNDHLQGLQTRICANLENPTTIVEFSPLGEPVRTDSNVLFFAMHPPCRKFRECSKQRWCLRMDNRQALLFNGLGGDLDDILYTLRDRISQSSAIRDFRRDNPGLEFELLVRQGRPFLAYDCPLLGYRELLFPVFFERRVIGTFFVGQLCLFEKLGLILQKQKDLFGAHPEYFEEYLRENPDSSVETIRDAVLKAHKSWIHDRSHLFSAGKYEEFIIKTCGELDGLEETLQKQMHAQRVAYVADQVEKRISEFREDLPREEGGGERERALLWENVRTQLQQIISDFAIRYFVVLAGGDPKAKSASRLEVVTTCGDLPDDLRKTIDAGELRFNLDKLSPRARKQWITSMEDAGIFEALEGWSDYDQETNLVRVFPVPLFPQASMVVLVGYHDWNPRSSTEHGPKGPLSNGLQSFYTVVLSTLSSVLAAAAEAKMETALRIFGHETGQLAAGFDWLRELYLSDVDKLRKLSQEQSQNLCNDLAGYMSQLLFLSKQARMILEIERPHKTYFLPYKQLLFKWTAIYRLELEKKELQFDIMIPAPDDQYRPRIWADQVLLEQVIYNLVNNAVKYCHRGTRISLDCSRESLLSNSPYILTVTNYGIRIEDGGRVYDLYGRGENTDKIEGLGIGLFIAKRIATAHGGKVEHACTKVSQFNVPLIEPYLREQLQWKGSKYMRDLERELVRLKRTGDYHKIVASANKVQKYSKPTRGELVNSINKHTWRVTFQVTIPAMEKQR